MDIAQKLSELMVSRQMSRGALARALGVHTSTVTNWLSGKAVKSETLPAICDVFGCSIDYLLGSETKKEPTATNGDELSGSDMKLVEAFSSLGRDMQAILDAIEKDQTYRPKREEKFVEVVCPLSGRVETIHQVYYVHEGKRVPYLNNGCDNCYDCAECHKCQVRVMESVR